MASTLDIAVADSAQPGIKVVTLSGEMDEGNLESLRQQLDPVLNDAGVSKLIFHLPELQFINSKGIGYFVSVHTHLTKNAKQMILANAQEVVMDVMSLVGLTSIIPYFQTLDEALAG